MKLKFSAMRITLVVAPYDMRSGYHRLAQIASALFDIDVNAGGDLVAFISRDRGVCKVIWSDEHGTSLLVRRLHAGRFESFLRDVETNPCKKFTAADLESFLDGVPLKKITKSSGRKA